MNVSDWRSKAVYRFELKKTMILTADTRGPLRALVKKCLGYRPLQVWKVRPCKGLVWKEIRKQINYSG